MAVTIRAFDHSECDYAAWVNLDNQIWTDYVTTIGERRHWAATVSKEAKWRWWVAEEDGQLKGTAYHGRNLQNTQPGSFILNINVGPSFRCQGLGSLLYEHCLNRLRAEHNRVLQIDGYTKESMLDSLSFLEHRGFNQVLREPHSQLLLQAFDPTHFQAKTQRTKSLGIIVKSLVELQLLFPDWKQRYYQLEMDLRADTPSAGSFKAPSFEEFNLRHFEDPEFDPTTLWIAIQDQNWLGVTGFSVKDADPTKGYTILTGVRRGARRQGIASVLKLKSLIHAKQSGLRVIQTDNEENNPMYQINLAFGFQPMPARLNFRKKFPFPS